MTAIRASDISSYVFCARAWWYAGRGVASENVAALEVGSAWHRRHGRQVLAAGCLRWVGFALILLALTGAAAYITWRGLG
ncbi:MAG TPA: hypothetical protein VLD63_05270 [Anaerolineales bacterium]|nr:hypothetical protein [Anaerolineales bacterium]